LEEEWASPLALGRNHGSTEDGWNSHPRAHPVIPKHLEGCLGLRRYYREASPPPDPVWRLKKKRLKKARPKKKKRCKKEARKRKKKNETSLLEEKKCLTYPRSAKKVRGKKR
jgi:hypothetical protein